MKDSYPHLCVHKTVAPIANSLLKWYKFMFIKLPIAFAAEALPNHGDCEPNCNSSQRVGAGVYEMGESTLTWNGDAH